MRNILIPIIIAAITTTSNARDIRLEDCPAGVRKTIDTKLDGGDIDDIEVVSRSGKTLYVVDIDGPGFRDITLSISPSGRLLSESEDLTFKQCPAKIRRAINRVMGMKAGWSLDDIDQVTSSKGVRFHVDIDRRGQRDLELVISSDGKVIKRKLERFDP